MITIDSIFHGGEVGQFRARDDAVGWKNADGSRVLVVASDSVLKAEWLDGTFKVLCRSRHDPASLDILTLDGFASGHFDQLFGYFREVCGIFIKKHKPAVSIDAGDFDAAMRLVEEAADSVDESQPGSVAKKAREADLMQKVGVLRDGLEKAVGGDKHALSHVFSANGCERIGRLRLVIRTVQLEVYREDPRWVHMRDMAKTIRAMLRELGTFQRWVPPSDVEYESQARRQMVWELKARQGGTQDGAGDDDDDDGGDEDGDGPGRPVGPALGGGSAPLTGRIDAAMLDHMASVVPCSMAPPPELSPQRGDAEEGGGAGGTGAGGPAAAAAAAPPPPPGAAAPAPAAQPPRKPAEGEGQPGTEQGGAGGRRPGHHPGSILEGWVWKQSRFLKQWRRRWFVLTPQRLDSYRQRGGGAATTETLYRGTVMRAFAADDELRLRNSFCVTGMGRRFYMVCDDQSEREEWVREISRVLLSAPVHKGLGSEQASGRVVPNGL